MHAKWSSIEIWFIWKWAWKVCSVILSNLLPRRSLYGTLRRSDTEQKVRSSAHSRKYPSESCTMTLTSQNLLTIHQKLCWQATLFFSQNGTKVHFYLQRNFLGGHFITWKHKSHSITDWLHKMYFRLTLKSAVTCSKSIALILFAGFSICCANLTSLIHWWFT